MDTFLYSRNKLNTVGSLNNKRIGLLGLATYFFIAFYPILPSYFRIAGFESGAVLSIVFSIIYIFITLIGKKTIRFTSLSIFFVVAGLVFSLESLVFGEYPRLITYLFQKCLIPICLIDFFIRDRRHITKSIDILLLVGFILSIFAIFESISKQSAFWFLYNGTSTDLTPDLQMRGYFARAETTFGHSITYGIYCSVLSLLAFFMYCKYEKKKYLLFYIMLGIGLLLTVSRAAIIIFAFSNVLMSILFGKKAIKKLLVVFLVSFFLLGLVSQLFPESIGSSISDLINILAAILFRDTDYMSSIEGAGDPFAYRFALFGLVPTIIQNNNWFFGIGAYSANNYSFLFDGYTYFSIDNSYVNMLLRYGVVGLFCNYFSMILIVIVSIRNFVKNKKMIYKCSFVLMLLYLINMISVAQMTEEKTYIVLACLFLACHEFDQHHSFSYKKTQVNDKAIITQN